MLIKKLKYWVRYSKPITKLLGQKIHRSRKRIEIDITYHCNLRCLNCNRSCRQAPSLLQIELTQIQKFIDESIDKNHQWEVIRILGGEPTLHPDISYILESLINYKYNHSPDTKIQLATNGCGKKVKHILSKIPKEIDILNSSKVTNSQFFSSFNSAPCDSFSYKFLNYSNGCKILTRCGMGLTPFGYYPCAVAGGIDRIIGSDCGRKTLPDNDDEMIDHLQLFCRLCGHFRPPDKTNLEIMSPFWKDAYKKYKDKQPVLKLY
ncbi:MAG: radical SAM protein [Deltaproteobacteria bacterium]|nr:radical SAM protein [Deltaproteobacteria bacterium]MBW2562677.1 radical SAM protein [Deltaproteobacteria bacterium]